MKDGAQYTPNVFEVKIIIQNFEQKIENLNNENLINIARLLMLSAEVCLPSNPPATYN